MAIPIGGALGPEASARPVEPMGAPPCSNHPAPSAPEGLTQRQRPSTSSHSDSSPVAPPKSATPGPPLQPPAEDLPNRLHGTTAAPHIKPHHSCKTPDGWRLHLVRTRAAQAPPSEAAAAGTGAGARGDGGGSGGAPLLPHRHYPVVLCPGLGSSGAYTFDLSPVVSLADYLATRGWDVWTVELRGGAAGRSRGLRRQGKGGRKRGGA